MNTHTLPDASAQFRAPVLDVWTSMDGIVVGYVGGTIREMVATFPTLDEALTAYHAAKAVAA